MLPLPHGRDFAALSDWKNYCAKQPGFWREAIVNSSPYAHIHQVRLHNAAIPLRPPRGAGATSSKFGLVQQKGTNASHNVIADRFTGRLYPLMLRWYFQCANQLFGSVSSAAVLAT